MQIINPKTPEEWNHHFVELNKMIERLPDVPELEFNREVNDLLYLESQIMLFESIDREYTAAYLYSDSLRAKADYWRDLEQAKARDYTLQRIDNYPNEKDRDAKIKLIIDPYTKMLRGARLVKDLIDAKKRLLARQEERLNQIIMVEKKIR